jgi:hypothetical protein
MIRNGYGTILNSSGGNEGNDGRVGESFIFFSFGETCFIDPMNQ